MKCMYTHVNTRDFSHSSEDEVWVKRGEDCLCSERERERERESTSALLVFGSASSIISIWKSSTRVARTCRSKVARRSGKREGVGLSRWLRVQHFVPKRRMPATCGGARGEKFASPAPVIGRTQYGALLMVLTYLRRRVNLIFSHRRRRVTGLFYLCHPALMSLVKEAAHVVQRRQGSASSFEFCTRLRP
jgi:hypothetical protein